MAVSRVYLNLNPRANISVDRGQIATIESFFGRYRVRRANLPAQIPAHSKFIFVTDLQGRLIAHPQYRHPVLAEGKAVRYAGEVSFANGELEWWSNASGNYRPDANHAAQAGLPMEKFFTHEDIRLGRHKSPNRPGASADPNGERPSVVRSGDSAGSIRGRTIQGLLKRGSNMFRKG